MQDQYLPVTIVSDGVLLRENLNKADKDGDWVRKVLRSHNVTLEDTWLLTVDAADTVFFIRREAAK